jgi:tetratricopeptide (TPR) repeat protein
MKLSSDPVVWTSVRELQRRLLVSIFLLLLCAVPLKAQGGRASDGIGTGGSNTIQGRVYFPDGKGGDLQLKVRLESTDMANLSTLTDMNGSFRFAGLQAGNYTVIVEGDQYFETYREVLTIDRQGSMTGRSPRVLNIPIHLRPKTGRHTRETTVGTVDASLSNVPPPALALYNKALEAAKSGDSKTAVEHLTGAIAIHPEFAQALNELGVQYIKLNQLDKAVEALRSAVKVAPDAFLPRLNYGRALLEVKRFPDAEKELREAVKKNDASAVAHLYLGVALVRLRKLDESEKELLRACKSGREDMGLAHYYLAGIYWGRREYKRAADALETYLKLSPQAPDAERVRSTINELRGKQ